MRIPSRLLPKRPKEATEDLFENQMGKLDKYVERTLKGWQGDLWSMHANVNCHLGGLQPGVGHLKRAYPKLYPKFIAFVAHGDPLETANEKVQKEGLLAAAAKRKKEQLERDLEKKRERKARGGLGRAAQGPKPCAGG